MCLSPYVSRSAVTTRFAQDSLCSTVRAEVPGSRTGDQNLFQVFITATGSVTTFFFLAGTKVISREAETAHYDFQGGFPLPIFPSHGPGLWTSHFPLWALVSSFVKRKNWKESES